MYRAPHKCPVCRGRMLVTRLSCPSCESQLEGKFDSCLFCSLSPEESYFLITFIKNRGNIKDVERELGVSYPTVRAALDGLILSLGLANTEGNSTSESADGNGTADAVQDDSSGGTADSTVGKRNNNTNDKTKAKKDILNLLAQHRITADEAAQRLKKL